MSLTFNGQILANIMREIVESIRLSGSVTSVSELDGITTITSVAHCLRKYELVSINDVEYPVESITDDTFTITGIGIVEEDDTWSSLAPYYHHGHILEVANIVEKFSKSNNIIDSFKTSPLIVLIQDFEEDHDNDGFDQIAKDVNIVIVGATSKDYYAADRYTNTFIPLLLPLYEKLMKAIKRSKYFTIDKDGLNHSKIDRMFYGSELGVQENIFEDFTDAVDIRGLDLKINKNKC